MAVNNPQSADRSYKFMYKLLGIDFHQYIYHTGEEIEFVGTEIPGTGKLKDIVVKVDGNLIQITEFMTTPLYDGKLHDLFEYHDSSRTDPEHKDCEVRTCVFSIANPNHGKICVKIDENITFKAKMIFTKNMNGWKVLNNLIYKTIIQEEFSKKDSIDLLILPDMDISLPIKTLMKMIIVLMAKANIPNEDFKNKIIECEIKVLSRFFKDDELSEMIEMLISETKNPEVARIIEKYGQGFHAIYFEGKEDGFKDGFNNGFNNGFDNGVANGKINVAKNMLKNGFDEQIISRNTGISISEIKKLKRKL